MIEQEYYYFAVELIDMILHGYLPVYLYNNMLRVKGIVNGIVDLYIMFGSFSKIHYSATISPHESTNFEFTADECIRSKGLHKRHYFQANGIAIT